MSEPLNLKIVVILTVGLALAALLGSLSNRLKLSPIFGYLLAGFIIGPNSPGIVADREMANQMSEIGVILMMFSVGMHFSWQDLYKVRRIAIPGAIGQTLVATAIATTLIHCMGWSLETGIIFGLAIGVASTMVLVRMLSDHRLLNTPQGHAAVGWLIVEDLITVIILLLIPTIAALSDGTSSGWDGIQYTVVPVILKFILLAAIMFTFGHKCITYLFTKTKLIKNHELFTLTVLAITFIIAIGSSMLIGTSIALGAFLAGMLIGQTKAHDNVAMKITPIRDTFVVIFFISVGMLFNPLGVLNNCGAFFITLAIILIAKPLTAILISMALKYPFKTAMTVAIGLAQIGEFSFILSEEAMRFDLLPKVGYDIIVACALISITINPLLFKLLKK